jgi:Uma2 family endonuclease
MIASPLEELIANRARLMPLTVEQYHRMLETGILRDGDPYELLDGYLVRKDRSAAGADPMTIGTDHTGGVELLGDLETDLRPRGYHIRVQQPVTILPDSEPEPDGAIVLGTIRSWFAAGRHPNEAEIPCLFEVSDSSLQHDRSTKRRIYADCGVPQYVIVNLVDRVIEVYTNPQRGQGRYKDVQVLRPGEKLRIILSATAHLDVAVDALLP